MGRHVGDCNVGFFLANKSVKEQSLDANLDVLGSYFERKRGLPVENPVWNDCDRKVSVGSFCELVKRDRNTSVQRYIKNLFDKTCDCTNEENFSEGSKISPKISPKFDVNIKSTNITNNIHRCYIGNDSSVG
jgi:hypothetical protein